MKTPVLLAAVTLCLLQPTFALADHDDDDERKRRHKRSHREVTWEGPCKVERTWKKNGDYQEKRECKTARRPVHVVVSQPPHVVYPPWFGEHPPAHETPRPSRRAHPSKHEAPVYRCDSATGAAILGGVLGGVAGHQIGKGSGQTAATIGGAIAGVLIGGEIGKRIDPHNQACIGQALEVSPAGSRLDWIASHDNNVKYSVTPSQAERRGDAWCRPYTATVITHGHAENTRQVACRQADGTWVRYN